MPSTNASNFNLPTTSPRIFLLKVTRKNDSQLLESILQNAMVNTNATMVSYSIRQLQRTENDVILEFVIEDNGTSNKHTRNFRYHRTLTAATELVQELMANQNL